MHIASKLNIGKAGRYWRKLVVRLGLMVAAAAILIWLAFYYLIEVEARGFKCREGSCSTVNGVSFCVDYDSCDEQKADFKRTQWSKYFSQLRIW